MGKILGGGCLTFILTFIICTVSVGGPLHLLTGMAGIGATMTSLVFGAFAAVGVAIVSAAARKYEKTKVR